MEPRDVRFFESAAELRDWFDANHATADELWLGYYRKGTGRTTLDWSAAGKFKAEIQTVGSL